MKYFLGFLLLLCLSDSCQGGEVTAVADSPDAGWFWQIMPAEIMVGVALALFTWIGKNILALVENLAAREEYKKHAAAIAAGEQALRWIGVMTVATYQDFVRELKEASADGRLTENEVREARRRTIEAAWEKIRSEGLDKASGITKEMLPLLVEQTVSYLKNSGKTGGNIPLPLPVLPELPPSGW